MKLMDFFLFRRRRPTANSSFSEFIRNASSGEKKRVYSDVLRRATERQRAVLDRRVSAD